MRGFVIAGALLLSAATALGFDGTLKLRTVAAPLDALKTGKSGTAPDSDALLAMMPAALLSKAGDGALVQEATVYVSGNKVRMDAPVAQGQEGSVIVFDTGTTWLVSPGEKQYIEWTQADAKAAAERMAQLKTALREQLPQMPPDKRKEAEAFLKQMEEQSKAKVSLNPLGKTQTISGMDTSAYKSVDGSITVVGWISEQYPDLSRALHNVSQRMRKLGGQPGQKESVRELMQAKGLPVMVQTVEPDSYRIEEVLTVDLKPVPASTFTVPKDYKKISGSEMLKKMMPAKPEPQG